jgi:hemin uptake protein HemP
MKFVDTQCGKCGAHVLLPADQVELFDDNIAQTKRYRGSAKSFRPDADVCCPFHDGATYWLRPAWQSVPVRVQRNQVPA